MRPHKNMEALYQSTMKLLLETQSQLQELSSFSTGNYSVLEARVTEGLQQLESDNERLKTLVNKEPIQTRQQWKNRWDQLNADICRLQNTFTIHKRQRQEAEEAVRARDELLSRSSYSNQVPSGDTAISMDHSLQHHSRLKTANSNMDELIANATSIFDGLKGQHSILKGAQRKMKDIANTLGLSDTVMRLIERRTAQDWYIFWGGVIVTFVIIFLVLRYVL